MLPWGPLIVLVPFFGVVRPLLRFFGLESLLGPVAGFLGLFGLVWPVSGLPIFYAVNLPKINLVL